MTVTPEETRRGTQPVDFVNVGILLSEEEKEIRDKARSLVDRCRLRRAPLAKRSQKA